MNLTPEQIDFVLQQAVFAATRALEQGGNPVANAVSVVEAAKAAAKALDQP